MSSTKKITPRFTTRAMLAATALACLLAAPVPWLGYPYVLHMSLACAVLACVSVFVSLRQNGLATASLILSFVAAVLLFIPGLMAGSFLSLLMLGLTHPVRTRPAFRIGLCALAMAVGVLPAIREKVLAGMLVDRLRAENPFESLRRRMPDPPTGDQAQRLDPALDAESELAAIEEQLEDNWRDRRSWMLGRLHQASYRRFVTSPGLGSVRMARVQPSALAVEPPESNDDPLGLSGMHNRDLLPQRLHSTVYLNMFASGPMGYVESVDRVAGFRPHALREFTSNDQSESQPLYELERIELVGLLMSEQPRVYQAGRFPQMDRLADAPTRDLDAFETAGLRHVRRGNELFHQETDAGLRMLGAVRAVKSCTECHDTQRGGLLGAFSYWVSGTRVQP